GPAPAATGARGAAAGCRGAARARPAPAPAPPRRRPGRARSSPRARAAPGATRSTIRSPAPPPAWCPASWGRSGPGRARLPGAAPHDERHVHLIGLVVEAQGVHGQVDAEAEGLLALQRPPGHDVVLPLAEAVPGPGAAEVVLAVDDQRP